MNSEERDQLIAEFKALLARGLNQSAVLVAMSEADPEQANHDGTIASARANYCDDDCEIDDHPLLSPADDGCWVSAWVWVTIEREISGMEEG